MEYDKWSHEELVKRVTQLEEELRAQNEKYGLLLIRSSDTGVVTLMCDRFSTLIPSASTPPAAASTPPKRKKKPTPFDPSKYTTRPIALKFAYLGGRYNGFEHHIGNSTPLPTIEEELWKALVKTRLIFPPSMYGEGGEEEAVVGDWEGAGYSKCGRTDRGVSAFGQVIGITVRSAKPKETEQTVTQGETSTGEAQNGLPIEAASDGTTEASPPPKPFDAIKDELPYIALLNRVLPPDIRVLAWCPSPPPNFDARFSCKERKYRYFFTSPAFLPLPGAAGTSSRTGGHREGWLDIEAMREAAGFLVGTHDFRNFCKVDPTKQLTSFTRRISAAAISRVAEVPSPEFARQFAEAAQGSLASGDMHLYSFDVQGSAFLWHQVRCMIGILFLIGQRLEQPTLVNELLDVSTNPCKPHYEMASDQPLVLWNCMFSVDPDKGKFGEGEKPQGYVDRGVGEDELEWVHAEEAGPSGAPGQVKWGPMGLMPDLWKGWRKAKMDEVLAGQLLDLVAKQSAGGEQQELLDKPAGKERENQRVFEGYDDAFPRGKYVTVMQKPKMDPVDVINARWAARKGRPTRFAAAPDSGVAQIP
jgi:tRNA pseudouridine38/39 synthase